MWRLLRLGARHSHSNYMYCVCVALSLVKVRVERDKIIIFSLKSVMSYIHISCAVALSTPGWL